MTWVWSTLFRCATIADFRWLSTTANITSTEILTELHFEAYCVRYSQQFIFEIANVRLNTVVLWLKLQFRQVSQESSKRQIISKGLYKQASEYFILSLSVYLSIHGYHTCLSHLTRSSSFLDAWSCDIHCMTLSRFFLTISRVSLAFARFSSRLIFARWSSPNVSFSSVRMYL